MPGDSLSRHKPTEALERRWLAALLPDRSRPRLKTYNKRRSTAFAVVVIASS